jgi:hypothetical protein
MGLLPEPIWEERLVARTTAPARLRPAARNLLGCLRHFLTPALWRQVRQDQPARRRAPRWQPQPLVLVLLVLTWASGDSLPERFETAKAFVALSLPKRRRPGRTAQGFQLALARTPMTLLRAVAAGVRRLLPVTLAAGWQVEGFVPIGCDGTRLACPRTPELERWLGQAGKPGSAPAVWLTALVHLRLGVPLAWRLGKGNASERTHLRHLTDVLPGGALVVADAGFVGYDLIRTLLSRRVSFLIRMSWMATFYRSGKGAPGHFHHGAVYYWPPEKKAGSGQQPPLPLRLIRVRSRRQRHDVWLATDVTDPSRLSRAQAARFYLWRWESEGFFRTYKRTLKKVTLVSRTLRLVHREAEGSLLAVQLLLAMGARAVSGRGCGPAAACSPRKVLLAIRKELQQAQAHRRRRSFARELSCAVRERRPRRSAKQTRAWPQRTPHKPPKPPQLLTLGQEQKARLSGHQT